MDEQENNLNEEQDQKFEFITETIKEKPISKKRILIKILFTLFLAVLFGVVAAFSLLISKPYMEAKLYPEEPKKVEIPRGEEQEEEAEEPKQEPVVVEKEPVVTQIVEKVEKVELEIDDYKKLNDQFYSLAKESEKSIVTVTGVSSNVDWFMNAYENENQTSGMIIADNGKELLILANKAVLESAERIQVTFCDATESAGEIKKYDANTGLVIVAVDLSTISEETMATIKPAEYGNKKASELLGIPIIAIGNPLGYSGSVALGNITSNSYVMNMEDTSMQLITTDIYGSKSGSGIIIDLDGKVLGIISQDSVGNDNVNLLKAYAITDLITTIEKLSNGQDIAYLGIKGTDVTEAVTEEVGVPMGAYVMEVIMDSPAMQVGIQSGDVIVKMGTTDILSFEDYKAAMMKSQPGDLMMITVKRQGKEGYIDLPYEVELGKLE
ncbi:MAG: serine protease [Clostridia bacterium]|nr:serine protease [Clostridia bacterium]